ncbi:MAG: GLUG motif-containing protein, partial [Sporomusa sp.]
MNTEKGDATTEQWTTLQNLITETKSKLENIFIEAINASPVQVVTSEMTSAERAQQTALLVAAISAVTGEEIDVPIDDLWDGISISEPAFDTATNSYQITKSTELAWFAKQVNAGNTSYNATLLNDISLNNQEWTQIGSATYPYVGTFDGAGYTISGININYTTTTSTYTYAGFFNRTGDGALIKNLTLDGAISSSGRIYTGGFVGYAVNTNISNCVNQIDITMATSLATAGGIAGYAVFGTISDCLNYGAIGTASREIGGIAGYAKLTNIEGCGNYGTITGTYRLGGIVGNYMVASNDANAVYYVRSCFNTADITGTGDSVGGIFGAVDESSLVSGPAAVYFSGLY